MTKAVKMLPEAVFACKASRFVALAATLDV
jgi:hypothetical protein